MPPALLQLAGSDPTNVLLSRQASGGSRFDFRGGMHKAMSSLSLAGRHQRVASSPVLPCSSSNDEPHVLSASHRVVIGGGAGSGAGTADSSARGSAVAAGTNTRLPHQPYPRQGLTRAYSACSIVSLGGQSVSSANSLMAASFARMQGHLIAADAAVAVATVAGKGGNATAATGETAGQQTATPPLPPPVSDEEEAVARRFAQAYLQVCDASDSGSCISCSVVVVIVCDVIVCSAVWIASLCSCVQGGDNR